jgi:hypothetical protein
MNAKRPKPKRPESSGVNQDLWDFWDRYEDKKADRKEWDAVQTPTATDKALKETRLADLDAELAKLDEEYQCFVRRAQDADQTTNLSGRDCFTLGVLAARWNVAEHDVFRWASSGALPTVVRPDAPESLHGVSSELLEDVVAARVLLVSREDRDRFEVALPNYVTHAAMEASAKCGGLSVEAWAEHSGQKIAPTTEGGRFVSGTLEEAARALARQEGWHDGALDTLLKQMVQAVKDGSLTARHPHTGIPYRPDPVRTFYEFVTAVDVNVWLASQAVDYRMETGGSGEAPMDVNVCQRKDAGPANGAVANDWLEDDSLLKIERQQRAILEVITMKRWDPMAVPDGEKGTIRQICEEDDRYRDLFSATSFERAWSAGVRADPPKWRMQSHASFAKGK